MLTTILNNHPPPKSVIIQDSLAVSGKNILFSIIRSHLNLNKYAVHLCLFENSPEKIKTLLSHENLFVYDFVSDNNGWISGTHQDEFLKLVHRADVTGVLVVDSLAHVILEYGVARTCRHLYTAPAQQANRIVQVLALLHDDVLPNKVQILKYFDHAVTLYLTLMSPAAGQNARVHYRHTKSAVKTVKQTEEFYFTNNVLQTKCLDRMAARLLLTSSAPAELLPENMSTFRISLDENEKKSREQLTLPYLKQAHIAESGSGGGGGNVIYNLDDIDDWDEEDPDDDLDI